MSIKLTIINRSAKAFDGNCELNVHYEVPFILLRISKLVVLSSLKPSFCKECFKYCLMKNKQTYIRTLYKFLFKNY